MKKRTLQLLSVWILELVILFPLALSELQISYSAAPVVTHNSAIVRFQTSDNSTARVYYSKLSNLLNLFAENTTVAKDHSVKMTNLDNSTVYYYQLVATNGSGYSATKRNGQNPYQLKTAPAPDTIPPSFVKDPSLTLPQDSQAMLTWDSDESASSFVFYGATANLGTVVTDANLVNHHVISLTVSKGNIYFYKVGMCDRQKNCINSSASSFIAGADNTPPVISVNIPEAWNNRLLTFTGTTKPLADVNVFVQNQFVRFAKADISGNFNIQNLALSTSETNIIRLEVKDSAGNLVTKEFQVVVDVVPPILTINNVTKTAKSQTVQIQGSVNKLAKVTFSVTMTKDLEPPVKVLGLTNVSVATNTVRLTWQKSKDSDFLIYAIYRDGIRISTTKENQFIDTGAMVDSGRLYRYKVSAVDDSCNEGPLSDEFAIRTLKGGQLYNKTPTAINLSCMKHSFDKSIELSGDFNEPVTLAQGINNLVVKAVDKAGNVASYSDTILLDTEPPKILETNLGALSPTYIPDITITGKISESSTVFIFINNDTSPSATTTTNANGGFSADVRLRRDVVIQHYQTYENQLPYDAATYKAPDAWTNTVRIVAMDDAGLKDNQQSNIILTECGFGSNWHVIVSKPTPDMLTPRLMIEGMDMIGLGVNISWQGGFENGTIRELSLRTRPLSGNEQKNWDLGWVTTDMAKTPTKKSAYIMLRVNPQDPSHGKNWTVLAKENNLSAHRVGECGVPGFGCLKIPLMLVIDYETKQYNYSQQQRQCFDVMVTIDRRIPSDKIPEAFLKASIEILNTTVKLIDTILKPLNTVKEYVFYGCAASWVVDFFLWFSEAYSCQYASTISVVQGVTQGKIERFDKAVAQVNRCDDVYPKESQNGAQAKTEMNNVCVKCKDAITRRVDFEKKYMHLICDRIFCPSAPTLEKYIRDQASGNPVKKIANTPYSVGSDCAAIVKDANGFYAIGDKSFRVTNGAVDVYDISKNDWVKSQYSNEQALIKAGGTSGTAPLQSEAQYTKTVPGGNTAYYKIVNGHVQSYDPDSATWMPTTAEGISTEADLKKQPTVYHAIAGTSTYTSSSRGKYILTYAKAKEIFDNYNKYKDTSEGDIKCTGLHEPKAQCCGVEYMGEWDSSCLVMNELKENICLKAEDEAKVDDAKSNGISCPITWNKVAGICAPDGVVQADLVDTRIRYKGSSNTKDETFSDECLFDSLNTREDYPTIYYRILPPNQASGNVDYRIDRGYLLTSKRIGELTNKNPTTANKLSTSSVSVDDTPITKELVFRLGNGGENEDQTTNFFIPGKTPENDPKAKPSTLCTSAGCRAFKADLDHCTENAVDPKRAQEIYDEIQSKVGRKEKEYIVDPTSGFLRSIQCVCLSAITGYLQLYKNMLTAVQSCFQTILITGDGSSGMCRAVLTIYVCDLIYDIISCVMEKYGGNYGRTDSGSIGNFFGALSNAGEGVNRAVQGRYKDSNLWQAMFSDRKIAHAICLFAFTGTWDLDVSAMINQQFTVPIQSEGFLYPCERRFMSFNPTTNPGGLTTWSYHFGVGLVAGAKLDNIRLRLYCSDGFKCTPADGYPSGKCDCVGKQQDITVGENIPTALNAGDMIFNNGDIYTTKPNQFVRYDRAELEWSYIDNNKKTVTQKATCNIKQTGGQPPEICAFDVGTGTYRCTLDMGSQNYAYFKSNPTADYGTGNDAFRVNNQMRFNYEIMQMLPTDSGCFGSMDCQYTKYLKVTIKNQNARVIYDGTYLPLNYQGLYADVLVPPNAIKPEDFTGSASTNPIVSASIGSANFVQREAQVTGNIDPGMFPFSVDLKKDGSQLVYKICTNPPSCTTWDGTVYVPVQNQEVSYRNVKVRFMTASPVTTDGVGRYEVTYTLYNNNPITCDPSMAKQPWTAVFQIYDAADLGGTYRPGTQVTIYNSKSQEYPLTFYVSCGTQDNSASGTCPASNIRTTAACYCANDALTGQTRDCQTNNYCVNRYCLDLQGCDSSGKTSASNFCVCDPSRYAANDRLNSVCAQGQYCVNQVCTQTAAKSDQCPKPAIAILTTCSCAGISDCAPGNWCVDSNCVDMYGCEDTGSWKIVQKCVCDGAKYKADPSTGTCDVDQFCNGNTCQGTASSSTTAAAAAPQLNDVMIRDDSGKTFSVTKSTPVFSASLAKDDYYHISVSGTSSKEIKDVTIGDREVTVNNIQTQSGYNWQGTAAYVAIDSGVLPLQATDSDGKQSDYYSLRLTVS